MYRLKESARRNIARIIEQNVHSYRVEKVKAEIEAIIAAGIEEVEPEPDKPKSE